MAVENVHFTKLEPRLQDTLQQSFTVDDTTRMCGNVQHQHRLFTACFFAFLLGKIFRSGLRRYRLRRRHRLGGSRVARYRRAGRFRLAHRLWLTGRSFRLIVFRLGRMRQLSAKQRVKFRLLINLRRMTNRLRLRTWFRLTRRCVPGIESRQGGIRRLRLAALHTHFTHAFVIVLERFFSILL